MGGKTRQSKDFHEIWNVQTKMQITQEAWDQKFHNWKEPWNCSGRKRPTGCTVCEALDLSNGIDIKGNSFRLGIVGDIHANINGLKKYVDEHPLYYTITLGDLCIYPDLDSAKKDKKSYEKNTAQIEHIIKSYNDNTLEPFSVHIRSLLGNHDNFINLEADIFKTLNMSYLKNGTLLEIGKLVIATLGGIYSPKKFNWNTSALKEYNKRFYTQEDINSLYEDIKKLGKPVDILITHEAAAQVLPPLPSGVDEGKDELLTLLKNINPKYYIHGHHHKAHETTYNDIKVIGLGNFKQNDNAFVEFNIITGERIN